MDTASHQKTKRLKPNSHLLPSIAIRSVVVVGAVLLVAVCVLCARWGFADLIVTDAMSRQALLQGEAARTGVTVTSKEAEEVITSLLRAQRIDPNNPATAEQLGGAYTIDVRKTDRQGSNRAVTREWAKADEQYSRAVALRPTSPYAWANRAWTKYYQGKVDMELYVAM